MAPKSMRLAVISDIHADAQALRDALVQAERLGCEQILCAGDVVGYGRFPSQTISLLRERDIPCVRGNHDRWAADPKMAGSAPGPLTSDALSYLSSLPRMWHGLVAGVRVAVCHGTPRSDMDGVLPGRVTSSDVQRWLAATDADVLVVGHTHAAAAVTDVGGGMIVNPGALLRDGSGSGPAPLVYDPKKRAFVESPAAPRGTFGILELPSKRFTVHLASDGGEIPCPRVTTGVTDRRK